MTKREYERMKRQLEKEYREKLDALDLVRSMSRGWQPDDGAEQEPPK